jgi:hypothetical protein
MKLTTVAAVAMAAAMAAQAGSRKPQADALVTVFTYDRAGVPRIVMGRAKAVAAMAFAAAGIEVRWVEGKRLGEPRVVAAGEALRVVFDGQAPADFRPHAMAFTNIGGGADANVHVFYNRVADAEDMRAQRSTGTHTRLPEFLGNVLAHELTHALEGVKRHSSEGLMKAEWNAGDLADMVYGPLPLAAEDRDLLRAHFRKEIASTLPIAAGN